MPANSHVISALDTGLLLNVAMGELGFTAYVVISEPNIDLVADIVPQEHYDNYSGLHVAAIPSPSEASDQITDIVFNMNQGDAVVFLCRDEAAYMAALHELGQHASHGPT